MLCSCQIFDEMMDEEVEEIGLTLWLNKPHTDGYFRVSYDLNKESDYCVIEYKTEPMTRVFWYSYDYYTFLYITIYYYTLLYITIYIYFLKKIYIYI